MEDAENYIAAGYRFELIAIDSAKTVGIYVISRLPESQ
jgi:hypothetical protein